MTGRGSETGALEHLVGEDGRRESGDQGGGIGDLHWHFPCP
jgi:hypothetical protein